MAKKSGRQLEREIAASLSAGGQPQLASMFSDPEARKVFAREMRHELQKKQTSQKTAAALAERPYVVKESSGALFGRYKTEAEARVAADRIGGTVLGPGAHATKKRSASRPTPYRIKLTPSEMRAVEFARGRYAWPDMLSAHAAEDGSIAFTESEMWQWTDDVDSDAEGGHSPFPLASSAFADKLQRFYDSRV